MKEKCYIKNELFNVRTIKKANLLRKRLKLGKKQ